MSNIVENRYDFVFIFDVKDGNPNGDPDTNNMPRIDPQTGEGIVSDVCLKRKVRNYVQMLRQNKRPFDIYIKERAVLNRQIEEAYAQPEVEEAEGYDRVDQARQWLCANYWDIRTFGALMTSGRNAGQVRGPVQMTFSRSVEPIFAMDNCITRMAVTTEAESVKQKGENRTMGRKYTVPYALYMGYGYISANLASQTGFSEEDLSLFWDGVINMFEDDHSSVRGRLCLRKLIVFRHESKYGNASAGMLFDLITIQKNHPETPSRDFRDYTLTINRADLPSGVTLIEKV